MNIEQIKEKLYSKAIDIVENAQPPDDLFDYARELTRAGSFDEIKAVYDVLEKNFFPEMEEPPEKWPHEVIESWQKKIEWITGIKPDWETAELIFSSTEEYDPRIDKDLEWWHEYKNSIPIAPAVDTRYLPEPFKKELENKKAEVFTAYHNKIESLLENYRGEKLAKPVRIDGKLEIYVSPKIKNWAIANPSILPFPLNKEIRFLVNRMPRDLEEVERETIDKYIDQLRKKSSKEALKLLEKGEDKYRDIDWLMER